LENLLWEQKRREKEDVKSDGKKDECGQESDTVKNLKVFILNSLKAEHAGATTQNGCLRTKPAACVGCGVALKN
jgi:hypothetical protein